MPDAMRGLVFRHPPAPLLAKIAADAVIGLYHAGTYEAPTTAYAGHFLERGHRLALPRLQDANGAMDFAAHVDPYGATDLERGPQAIMQPASGAEELRPDILFVPLVGFTEKGERLGQGGGHYDRWLAAHPGVPAIGLAWDVQRCEQLPIEPHDVTLDAVVTPTRLYGPF